MIVLLEYIDHSLTIFHKRINIAIYLFYIFPIMLNAFNDPLRSKLCWYNRRVFSSYPIFISDFKKYCTLVTYCPLYSAIFSIATYCPCNLRISLLSNSLQENLVCFYKLSVHVTQKIIILRRHINEAKF